MAKVMENGHQQNRKEKILKLGKKNPAVRQD
jgi:hypothetical protein